MKVASAVAHPDVYPDRHLNVFVPYGTHDLDYNVTRAMISTLRWSVPDLARQFLAEVANVASDGTAAFQFDLQASDFEDYDPSRAKRKVILGISTAGRCAAHMPLDSVDRARLVQALQAPPGLPRITALAAAIGRPDMDPDEAACLAHAVTELQSGSLPDGWIFSTDGSLCVLIEAKLLALLDPSQLDRHAEVWFGRKRTGEDLVVTSWAKVAAFFGKNRGHPDAKTAFLCRQLFDYIDLLGFAPFEGFKPYDFDGDTIPDALPKFRRFVEEAKKLATSEGAPLGEIHSTATGSRIALANPRAPGEVRFELTTAGIRVGWRCEADAAERLLEATEDGKKNPWTGVKLVSKGLQARVERLIPSQGGLVADAETYAQEFDPSRMSEALAELRLQNPLKQGRELRKGALEVAGLIARDSALDGRDGVLAAATKLVFDALRLVERVV